MGHTPARNVSIQRPGLLESIYKPNSGPTVISSYSRPTGRFHDRRPESFHTTRGSDGKYHQPMGWTHEGGTTGTESWYEMSTSSGTYTRTNEFRWWEVPTISGTAYNHFKRTAIINALGKAGNDIRQTGVFLREADEVLRLANRFGTGVRTGLHRVNEILQRSPGAREDMRSFLRHGWKEAPSFYLAYLFGVAPLGQDLQTAVSALNDLRGEDVFIVLKLRAKYESADVVEVGLQGFFGQVNAFMNLQQDFTARAQLRFKMPTAKLRAFEFVTPFSEAWETTRLSFVLDYILPVGNWLAGLEGAQIAPFFLDGTFSLKVKSTSLGGSRVTSSYPILGWNVTGDGEYNQYFREVLNTFPYTSILKPPRFQMPKLKQLGVVAALVGQQLTKLYKTLDRTDASRKAMDRAAARRQRRGRGS